MGVMKELYFDSWKSESYPYVGITRIRFKGYNLSLAAPHSFRGAKVNRFLKDEREILCWVALSFDFFQNDFVRRQPVHAVELVCRQPFCGFVLFQCQAAALDTAPIALHC